MSTIDKLNKLSQTKEDIKQAIISKGETISDNDTFASYADKISNLSVGEAGPCGPAGSTSADRLTTSIEVNRQIYNQVNGKITLPNYPSI